MCRCNFKLIAVSLIAGLALAVSYWQGFRRGQQSSPVRSQLYLQAGHYGRFASGCPWSLTVNYDGKIQTKWYKDRTEIEHGQLTEETIARLRDVLLRNRFSELPNEVGQCVVCGATRTIVADVDGHRRVIEIFTLPDEFLAIPKNRDIAQRALAIWVEIRDLISSSDPVDSRDSDREILRLERLPVTGQ